MKKESLLFVEELLFELFLATEIQFTFWLCLLW